MTRPSDQSPEPDRTTGRERSPDRGEAPTDLDLLQGIACGDEAAFRGLFRRWAPRLRSFLVRATGSREVGEDLLQEAFMRIHGAAERFAPHGKPGAWMYRICANLAYSYWRREKRSPVRGVDDERAPLELPAPAGENPENRMMRAVFSDELRSALQRLPRNQRLVFLLKVDQGLTYMEIATVLQCPEGTAKSRFHHAVQRLRALLDEWRPDGPDKTGWPPDERRLGGDRSFFLRRSRS